MKTRNLILVSIFAALTAIGAFIRIPIPYVPFTLQYLFCALAGMVLGSKLGALSQLIYVFIGLIGLPVFTEGGGPGYILKPTFGYIIGFIVGAYVVGKITENIKILTVKKAFFSSLIGLIVVYIFGVIYLYGIYNLYLGQVTSIMWAIMYGAIACVGGDIIVCFAGSLLAVRIVPYFRKKSVLKIKAYKN